MTRTPTDIWLAPSLLAADWARAGEQVRELESAGVEWLHFDAMDGHFVPNLSFGALFLKALRPHCGCHFDAHLMVTNPDERIPEFLEAGAQSISVHVENNANLHRTLGKIREGGALAGVVLNPATPVSSLEMVLPEVDYVLVMSVNPGFGGQKFLPLALRKIESLAQKRAEQNLGFKIQIDGGVTAQNAGEIAHAGCDILVAGSSVFQTSQSLTQNVAQIRAAVSQGMRD